MGQVREQDGNAMPSAGRSTISSASPGPSRATIREPGAVLLGQGGQVGILGPLGVLHQFRRL